MYAVIEDGGHQYRVREGEMLRVERRKNLAAGDEVVLDKVLLTGGEDGVVVGTPHIAGASVTAVVEATPVKGVKVRGMKRRLVNTSKTKWGHRQTYTLLRIRNIHTPGGPRPESGDPSPAAESAPTED